MLQLGMQRLNEHFHGCGTQAEIWVGESRANFQDDILNRYQREDKMVGLILLQLSECSTDMVQMLGILNRFIPSATRGCSVGVSRVLVTPAAAGACLHG